MKAITIQQPHATLICMGEINVISRVWPIHKKMIGQRILIHAGAGHHGELRNISRMFTEEQWNSLSEKAKSEVLNARPIMSSIIGGVVVKECVMDFKSVWSEEGMYHWVFEKPELFDKPILGVFGKTGIWNYG